MGERFTPEEGVVNSNDLAKKIKPQAFDSVPGAIVPQNSRLNPGIDPIASALEEHDREIFERELEELREKIYAGS